jgi:hypothetical protein
MYLDTFYCYIHPYLRKIIWTTNIFVFQVQNFNTKQYSNLNLSLSIVLSSYNSYSPISPTTSLISTHFTLTSVQNIFFFLSSLVPNRSASASKKKKKKKIALPLPEFSSVADPWHSSPARPLSPFSDPLHLVSLLPAPSLPRLEDAHRG